MGLRNYTELETWQRAMDLAEAVYNATRSYPREETGSLCELETQLRLGGRLGYVDDVSVDGLLKQSATVGRLINGLIRSVAPPPDSE